MTAKLEFLTHLKSEAFCFLLEAPSHWLGPLTLGAKTPYSGTDKIL